MMTRLEKRMSGVADDSGAILAYVAVAMIVMLGVSTFVADYGVLWASRRQAQNSADAAAMAGAIALAYDDGTDLTYSGPAKESALLVSQKNFVWGAAPSVSSTSDISFPTCPDGVGTCIRVNVYRNAERGDALPMFFGYFVGLSTQDVRATATAEVEFANATDCLKPWAVVDKWAEHYPVDPAPWTLTSTFDKYDKFGNPNPAITTPDVYVAPTEDDFGTGFHPYESDGKTRTSDYGLELTLKLGNQNDFDFATGWFAALALLDSKGGHDYLNNIKHCVGVTYKIGDSIPINTEPGEKVGPTEQATEGDIDSLINQDPGAFWDPNLLGPNIGGVSHSAYGMSPRVVAIPLVNPDIMMEVQKGGRTDVPIANIMGFFVDHYDNSAKSVVGYLCAMPGKLAGPGGVKGTFLRTIVLVQ
jgi:Putative Flp pilus-assembly TadE/G-like